MKLVLLRHGESVWNKENKFTGWTDVQLSDKGIEESIKAGKLLKANGFYFDIAFTSLLTRAKDTLNLVLKELGQENIQVKCNWKLNERHYGDLQGLNKKETALKYGEEQVLLWRRSADVKPPALPKEDSRYPGRDDNYKNLSAEEIPLSESLLDTMKRVLKYWDTDIQKELLSNKDIIIVAHGNSLRSLIKYLDNVSDEEIMNIEIPTGIPLVYELDDSFRTLNKYYLQ